MLIGIITYKTSMMYSYAIFTDSIVGEKTIELTYMPERTKEFKYTGNYEEYEVPQSGYYYIELGGAQGGYAGGKGAITSGYIKLEKGDKLYFYVGKQGTNVNTNCREEGYEFNGGGIAKPTAGTSKCGATGGGATDVRLESGKWDNINSLLSRIMVAGAGGASTNDTRNKPHGGTIYGVWTIDGSLQYYIGNPGTQTAGGAEPAQYSGSESNGTAGSFGKGGYGGANSATNYSGGGSGGGSGYYGGSGTSGIYSGAVPGGGAGSSYISGYAGVNSVKDDENIVHTNDTLHYSGKYFIGGEMLEGQNTGDGYAKITYVGEKPKRENSNLDNVRYIKSCSTDNTNNRGSYWSELQAIYEGKNIALGKSITGDYSALDGYPYENAVDGNISNFTGSVAVNKVACITVDLGSNYNLDEVAVWHYDGISLQRVHYDDKLYISSDDNKWVEVIDEASVETSNGHRVNAYREHVNGYVQDGLVLWYDGYANTGVRRNLTTTTWKDLSGNNNDLTISGDATWNEDNLQFDGAGYAYKTAVDYKINDNEYTISVIAMPTSTDGGDVNYSYYQRIFTNTNTGSNGDAYMNIYFRYPNFVYGSADGATTTSTISYSVEESGLNKVYSLSSVLKNNTLYAYNAYNLKDSKVLEFIPKIVTKGVYVGGSGASFLTFKGKVYSIRVYNRALTEEELLHNYKFDKLKYDLQ